MKQDNNYYIDNNENKWSKRKFTEKQAEDFSKTLRNCSHCNNCRICIDCNYCNNCDHCENCYKCNYCSYCYKCSRCYHCNDCHGCDNCHYCNNCNNHCHDCSHCYNCNHCSYCNYCNDCGYCNNCDRCNKCEFASRIFDCNTQPQLYHTEKIGSRSDVTIFFKTDTKIFVSCGCFKGTLLEFEKAVNTTHENNDLYRNQYLTEIGKVKILFGVDEYTQEENK